MTKEIFASYRDFYRHQLLDDCIPFWEHSDLLDRKFGGYITSVDREGKSYNDDKSVWFQGRCLWTFSALMNRYGKKAAWEEGAEIGKGFLEKFCTDADGRMFFTVTQDGRPLRKRRYMFSESFYVVSMAEYAAATGDAEALRKAEECFELMLRLYRTPESDPYKITPKTYASTRADRASAVPMVLVSSAQLLRRCDQSRLLHQGDQRDGRRDHRLPLQARAQMRAGMRRPERRVHRQSGRTLRQPRAFDGELVVFDERGHLLRQQGVAGKGAEHPRLVARAGLG